MSEYTPHGRRSPTRVRKKRRNLLFPILPACFLLIACVGSICLLAHSADAETAPAPDDVSSVVSAVPPPQSESEDETVDTGAVLAKDNTRDWKKEFYVPVLQTTAELMQHRVETQLKRLSSYFKDGSYWNHIGIDISDMSEIDRAMCVTDTPCMHTENGYDFCNIYNGVMAEYFPQYDYETQCLAYASLVSDLIFGLDAPVTEFYDFDSLHVGDHIRLVENEHSMIVTDIDWDTETLTVTEVNSDYENCQISWGRQITRSELYSMESQPLFFTRYED